MFNPLRGPIQRITPCQIHFKPVVSPLEGGSLLSHAALQRIMKYRQK